VRAARETAEAARAAETEAHAATTAELIKLRMRVAKVRDACVTACRNALTQIDSEKAMRIAAEAERDEAIARLEQRVSAVAAGHSIPGEELAELYERETAGRVAAEAERDEATARHKRQIDELEEKLREQEEQAGLRGAHMIGREARAVAALQTAEAAADARAAADGQQIADLRRELQTSLTVANGQTAAAMAARSAAKERAYDLNRRVREVQQLLEEESARAARLEAALQTVVEEHAAAAEARGRAEQQDLHAATEERLKNTRFTLKHALTELSCARQRIAQLQAAATALAARQPSASSPAPPAQRVEAAEEQQPAPSPPPAAQGDDEQAGAEEANATAASAEPAGADTGLLLPAPAPRQPARSPSLSPPPL
jgi:signal transduction histidine kinase